MTFVIGGDVMPFLILAAIVLALTATGARADQMFENEASSACATLAASPDEPSSEGSGVRLADINIAEATTACEAAVASPVATSSDHYHMARAYLQAGRAGDYAQELRLSAEAGYAPAQADLGREYIDGMLPQDYATGRHWLERAANQGDAYGLVALGYMEWNGFGGPLDREAAIRHEKQAADLGNEDGSANFALYSGQFANAQADRDASGQTYGEAVEEVQRQEAEQRKEIERQNCQFNRSLGDAAAEWAGC